MRSQKDLLQDVLLTAQPNREKGGVADTMQVQSQIADVIEPTAEKLLPIAQELKDVYRQIELLEVPPSPCPPFPLCPLLPFFYSPLPFTPPLLPLSAPSPPPPRYSPLLHL